MFSLGKQQTLCNGQVDFRPVLEPASGKEKYLTSAGNKFQQSEVCFSNEISGPINIYLSKKNLFLSLQTFVPSG
jgi:hypothetical protein